MIVWVFTVIVWLSSGPFYIFYGPYPNWVVCYKEMAEVKKQFPEQNYDMHNCRAVTEEDFKRNEGMP